MAIVGFFETFLFFGTINTTAGTSKQINFGAPLTLWSKPSLQSCFNNEDDGSVALGISQFKDNTGTHNVNFDGIFAPNCNSVTFTMSTTDCIATAILTNQIFG
jgi:hypothetical protein